MLCFGPFRLLRHSIYDANGKKREVQMAKAHCLYSSETIDTGSKISLEQSRRHCPPHANKYMFRASSKTMPRRSQQRVHPSLQSPPFITFAYRVSLLCAAQNWGLRQSRPNVACFCSPNGIFGSRSHVGQYFKYGLRIPSSKWSPHIVRTFPGQEYQASFTHVGSMQSGLVDRGSECCSHVRKTPLSPGWCVATWLQSLPLQIGGGSGSGGSGGG